MELDARQQRGLVIAATAKIQRKGAAWVVPSQSENGRYTVALDDGGRCTCPDFELRQHACKHIFAVEFVVKRETAPDGTVTETAAARITYRQDWPRYNAAQTNEKDHFCRLLRDLCGALPEPPSGRGRPRLPIADMVFAAAFKVYGTTSARRCMSDLRDAAERGLIRKAPHYNSIFNCIESEAITPHLHDLIAASAAPLREVECDFAIDSTGFGTSQFFRFYTEKYGREITGHDWLKVHAMVGVKMNVVTAVNVLPRDTGDSPQLRELVRRTGLNFTMREISADKAYSSHENYNLIAKTGAEPFIPFRQGTRRTPQSPVWSRMWHMFALNREEFLAHYHKRSNVEATFAAIKRVFGDSVRSKTRPAQVNEILLKILCHNIRCLIHAMYELGVDPGFRPVVGAAA